jgi:hypothetical protein
MKYRDIELAIAPGRKALRPSFPLRLQLSPHAQLCVSPFRRDCRSAGQVLDARGPLCLFLESLRARFWSPFRRKTRWPCVRRKHVHRRRDRATIDRRSRCYKSCAGARTSLASAESTNAGAHSFLTACQPAGFVFRGDRYPGGFRGRPTFCPSSGRTEGEVEMTPAHRTAGDAPPTGDLSPRRNNFFVPLVEQHF